LRIRWKLFLALFGVAGGVAIGVLWLAERQFRGWVRAQVVERFEGEVAELLEARSERLGETLEVASELAAEPAVAEALRGGVERGEAERVRERYFAALGERRRARGARAGGGRAPVMPTMGVVDREGEVEFFGRAVGVRRARRDPGRRRELGALGVEGRSSVGYAAVDEGLRRQVKEFVLCPVVDGGELLGWFLLGRDAATFEERRAAREGGADGEALRTGLLVEGEWFGSELEEGAERELLRRLEAGEVAGSSEVIEFDGEPMLVLARELNPDSPLGRGVQVGLFPLARLEAAVTRLRLGVSGLALAAVALSGGVGWWLSRRFSEPIQALVAGAARVRAGDFGGRVELSSRDEFGELGREFNAMTEGLAQRERYREVLSKTSDPAVAERLMDGSLELGGELREAAVVFCDIRGFTPLSERLSPPELLARLNAHMSAMTAVIHEHGGVVDKFVGDLVMAVFGAPLGRPDDLERAVACARAMVAERRRLNASDPPGFEIGIGLTVGELVAGLMGSSERLNYTVLGPRVNLAARLCGLAGAGEVWIDGETAERLGPEVEREPHGPVEVRGVSDAVEVWSLR